MKRRAITAVLFYSAFAASGAFAETMGQAYQRVSAAVAAAQQTRTRSELTKNAIPVSVGECTEPRLFKDPLERTRVGMHLEATYCREKTTFEERADGAEGGGLFRRTRWVRVPGSERSTYEYAIENEAFDLSYDPDSFRTGETILRDLRDACRSARDRLRLRALNERGQVRCRS